MSPITDNSGVIRFRLGVPIAAATCLPTPLEGSEVGTRTTPRFHESTVAVINCKTTLVDLINTTIRDLPTLSVLTSAPEILTRVNVSIAVDILESYVSQAQQEVRKRVTIKTFYVVITSSGVFPLSLTAYRSKAKTT